MMIRTFIAGIIHDSSLNILINERKKIDIFHNNLKWEQKSKMHLTLKFIGEIEENCIKEISLNLIKQLNLIKPIDLAFSKFGFFFKKTQPVILYAGLKSSPDLSNLADLIDFALEPYGIKKENKIFKPHITLLRIKNNLDSNFIEAFNNSNLELINFTLSEIGIFKSILKPNGAEYIKLYSFFLKNNKEE